MEFTENDKVKIYSIKERMVFYLDEWVNICYQSYTDKAPKKKFWQSRIPTLPERPHIYIAGGAIASLLQDESPKDIDIFFKLQSEQDAVRIVYQDILKDHIQVFVPYGSKTQSVYGAVPKETSGLTANAINLNPIMYNNQIYQLILKKGCDGEPETVVDTFDFAHCQAYYTYPDNILHISPLTYKCCVDKILYNPHHTRTGTSNLQKQFIHNPRRIHKFMERGYRIRGGFWIPNKTPLNSTDVGKDYVYVDEHTPRKLQEEMIRVNM